MKNKFTFASELSCSNYKNFFPLGEVACNLPNPVGFFIA